MRRERITITLNPNIIRKVDKIIDGRKIRNRSHAIESILKRSFSENISQALVLSAGKLVSTQDSSKPMPGSLIRFKDKPILSYQLDQLRDAGINKVIICVGKHKNLFEKELPELDLSDLEVVLSEEKSPKGTASTVLSAGKHLKDAPFLVVHGDVLTTFDFDHFINFHDSDRYEATISLITVTDPEPFGMVKVKGSEITNFEEKPKKEKSSNLISSGVYILEPTVLDLIDEVSAKSMELDIFPVLAEREKLYSYISSEKWFDLSYKEFYKKALDEF